MATVSVTEQINAPAEKVWALVADFGGTDQWIPGVGSLSVVGQGVGAIRTATLASDSGSISGEIQERLETYDADEYTYSYAIIGESPLPVTDYLASMTVTEDTAGSCSVTWVSMWEPVAVPEQQIREMLEGLYRASLANVQRMLSK